MDLVYLVSVWVHVGTVAFWIGAMFFEDPASDRFFSRLVDRMGGVGWYAQAVLWTTGIIMLNHRGISVEQLFTSEFIGTTWGKLLWAKLVLVLGLLGFQVVVGHRASKLVYGYVLLSFIIVGISVLLVRPLLF
jgi:putative copper export protein